MRTLTERRGSLFAIIITFAFIFLFAASFPVYGSDSEVPEHDTEFVYQNGAIKKGTESGINRIENGSVLMEKVTVMNKNEEKAKFKLTVQTSRSDSYWKGMNISISGSDGPLYDDSIESTKGEVTFDMPETGVLYIGLKPGGDKPSKDSYSIKYRITSDNGASAETTVKYKPVVSQKGLFVAAAILSMAVIFLLLLAKKARKKAGIIMILAFITLFSAFYAAGIRTDIAVNKSMDPDVKKGSLVISKAGVPSEKISKGDIVIYSSDDLTISGMEKVVKKEPGYLYTKTNEKMAMENQIKESKVNRKVLFSIPYVGKVIEFVTGFFRK